MTPSRRLRNRRSDARSIVLSGLALIVAFGTMACHDAVSPMTDTAAAYDLAAVGASNEGAISNVQVRQDAFPVTSAHVVWLAQPTPEVLASGNVKFEGWAHLWYDDAADDRLDGYDTVVADGIFGADGSLVYVHGTFTVREKLDDLQFDDFLDGNFDLSQIVQGKILFQGRFALTPQRPLDSPGIEAVAMNGEGLKAYYFFPDPLEFPVLHSIARIVDPNGR